MNEEILNVLHSRLAAKRTACACDCTPLSDKPEKSTKADRRSVGKPQPEIKGQPG